MMLLTGIYRNRIYMRFHLQRYLLFGLIILLVAACGANQPIPPKDDLTLETLLAEVPLTEQAVILLTPNTATPSIQPAATETLMPTATFTLAPTLAPTRPPEDPRWKFGDPDWTDPFENASHWTPYESERAKAEVRDGKFFYTMHVNDSLADWTVSGLSISSFYLEINAYTPSECSGKDRYGVIFRAPYPGEGYLLNLSCDGQFRLVTISSSGVGGLVPWTSHSAILAGPNQVNRIGIWADRKTIAIYINGIAVAGLQDDTYTQAGKFGLSIASENTPNFTVAFDDLAFWTIH